MDQRVYGEKIDGVPAPQPSHVKRLVATTGRPCPLGCIYCFANESEYNPPARFPTASSYARSSDLSEYSLIQPACDTELLLNAAQGVAILRGMIKLRKDVSFATKLVPDKDTFRVLREISDSLRQQGNVLSVSVSICCTASAKIIEPKAPSPRSRIDAVKRFNEENIHCIVAIRPLFPFVSTEELFEIIDSTCLSCDGYTTGPYYFKKGNEKLMSLFRQSPGSTINGAKNSDWLIDPEKWTKTEAPELEQILRNYIYTHTKLKLYSSNIEAVYSSRFLP